MGRRPKYRKSAMEGLVVFDKPLGWSSMEVVRRVRDAAGFVKTGHAGTLDPLATGVVICCIGRATRAVEFLMAQPKVYEAQIDLSAFTATDDREADREEVEVETPPTEEAVRHALASFDGEIEQSPPQFSAVHVDGKRAYKRARQGETVDLPTRTVQVYGTELIDYAWPVISLTITCGRGFYVRSMARDLGQVLGTGGHLAGLRRTAIGPYDLAQAIGVARLADPIRQVDLLPTPALPPKRS